VVHSFKYKFVPRRKCYIFSTRNKLHLKIFIAAFCVGCFLGKLISNNKLQLSPTYICSLSHSYSQLFYRLVCVSKRLRQQMEQPSVMTFQMPYEFFWKSCCFLHLPLHFYASCAAECTESFCPKTSVFSMLDCYCFIFRK